MKHNNLIFLTILTALMLSGCTPSGGPAPTVPAAKRLGLDDLERLCDADSAHLKALLFTNPYCSGCRHELRERLGPLLEQADTSRWRIYYLLVVDSADTLDYSRFMADCARAGIDTARAYIWRHYSYAEDYNRLFARFPSLHPLEGSISGIPRTLLLDRRNRLAAQRMVSLDDPSDFWYAPMELDSLSLSLDDFSTEDTTWYLLSRRSKPQFACKDGVCR